MQVKVIYESSKNHTHYCHVQIEQNRVIGSFWIPTKSKGKKSLSFEYVNDVLVVQDPEHIVKTKIEAQDVYSYLAKLMEYLIREDMKYLQKVEARLEKIEDQLMQHKGSHYESSIFEMRKMVSAFDSYYDQMVEVVQSLQAYSKLPLLDTLEKRLVRLSSITDRLSEYSIQLREMHQTQVEMHQNQIMQFLTIVTTIFMPLTLITGWYGMNFKEMPELDSTYGYIVVIGVCALIIVLEILYFKKKKWF